MTCEALNMDCMNFVGTEIDREYFEEQEKRFKDHCAQGCLFTFFGGEVLS